MTMRRTVKRIIDGDTFEVARKIGTTNRIRIAGYNAPEKHLLGGRRATNRLRGLIGGKTVTIRPVAKSYGRVVANVTSNRRDVARRLKRR